MVRATIDVQKSGKPNDTQELAIVTLPGVPRVGDTLAAKGADFEVRAVCWFDDADWVSLTVFSLSYGYDFPIPEHSRRT